MPCHFRPVPDRPDLDALLRHAATHVITPREAWLQRVSFAYGNASMNNSRITREMVEAGATRIYGPCLAEDK